MQLNLASGRSAANQNIVTPIFNKAVPPAVPENDLMDI
jgi:hypothetical protein